MPKYITQVSKKSGEPYLIMDKTARDQISAEVTAREAAVAAEASARDAAIMAAVAVETANRESAVSDLQSALDDANSRELPYINNSIIGEQDNVKYDPIVLPESNDGMIKIGNNGKIVVVSTSNYLYYIIDVESIYYEATIWQKTSSSYPYYIYATDVNGKIIASYGQTPEVAGSYTYVVKLPFNANRLYVGVYKRTDYTAKIKIGTFDSLRKVLDDSNKNCVGYTDTMAEYLSVDQIGGNDSIASSEVLDVPFVVGGVQGSIGEKPLIRNSQLYEYAVVDTSGHKNWSCKINQSTSTSYPNYVFATDIYGKIIYIGAEKGDAVRTITANIIVPPEAVNMYVMTVIDASAPPRITKNVCFTTTERLSALENNPTAYRDIIAAKGTAFLAHNNAARYLNLAVITDTHVTSTEENNHKFVRCINLYCDIAEMTDGGVHLGDITQAGAYVTKNDAIFNACVAANLFRETNAPIYFARGNHDVNTRYVDAQTGTVTDSEAVSPSIFNSIYLSSYKAQLAVHDTDNQSSNYYYRDFDEYKVRLIILSDYEESTADAIQALGEEQIKWLAESALNLTSKTTPTDWVVLLCKHTQTVSGSGSGGDISHIIHGFMLGSDSETTYRTSFAEQGAIPLILIHGHNHSDIYDNDDYYSRIGIDKAFATSSADTMIGTQNEFCFDVFTVDTSNKILYETRFGRGADRAYKYGIYGKTNNYQIL